MAKNGATTNPVEDASNAELRYEDVGIDGITVYHMNCGAIETASNRHKKRKNITFLCSTGVYDMITHIGITHFCHISYNNSSHNHSIININ